MSGGGFMLLSSNSATTLGGRSDPITTGVIIITSAVIRSEGFDSEVRCVNFVPTVTVLPRFEIQVTIVTFISSNRFPVWISLVCAYLKFIASIFLKIFYFF